MLILYHITYQKDLLWTIVFDHFRMSFFLDYYVQKEGNTIFCNSKNVSIFQIEL
jgi:hypothetical protein